MAAQAAINRTYSPKKTFEALISQSFKVSFYAWTLSRFRMNYMNFFTFCELFGVNSSCAAAKRAIGTRNGEQET